MGHTRKGGRILKEDLWIRAGGEQRVIKELLDLQIIKRETSWNSEVWPELSIRLFSVNQERLKKWLYVVWLQDRRGVRTATQQLTSQAIVHVGDHVCSSKSVHTSTTETSTGNLDEVRNDESSIHAYDTDPGGGNQTADDLQGTTDTATNTDAAIDTATATDTGDESLDDVKSEESAVLETDSCLGGKRQLRKVKSDIGKTPPVKKIQSTNEKDQYRPIQPGPKTFKMCIKRSIWDKIKPSHGSSKLRKSWTHVLYRSFREPKSR